MATRVSLVDRDSVVPVRDGRLASVAIPVVEHPDHGPCLVVTERSTINGHTGKPMSNAGEVVLFGGGRHADETGAEAALRELAEESGAPASAFAVIEHVGTWVTERGYTADGYLVAVAPTFVDELRPDSREVSRVAFLPLADVYATECAAEFHVVYPVDRWPGGDELMEFESPTLRVTDPDHGDTWLLWGLAGHMVATLRDRYADPERLLDRIAAP